MSQAFSHTMEHVPASDSAHPNPVRIPLDLVLSKRGDFQGLLPVAFGVPLPQSLVPNAEFGNLVNAEGRQLPVQLTPQNHWPDGSVQWLLADVLLPGDGLSGEWVLEIPTDQASPSNNSASPLSVRETDQEMVIRTGRADFRIDRAHLRPMGQVHIAGRDQIQAGTLGVCLTDRQGRRWEADCTAWKVETSGPVRCTLVGEGTFHRVRGLRLRLRASFYAETGLVQLQVSLHNPRRAKHPGGIWDLGDAGSILFRELSLELKIPEGCERDRISFSVQEGPNESAHELAIYQDSSGGENWQSANHVNRVGQVPCRFRGYRLVADQRELFGQRAEPQVLLRHAAGRIGLAVPEFWQQFPKAIAVSPNRISVGLFPGEFADLHELQGGERKTHALWLEFQGPESQANDLAWVHAPVIVRPKPAWCDATGTLPVMQLTPSESLNRLELLLEESLEGPGSLFQNRERVDEYGWRNYGDVFADHEQTYYTGPEPLISHYNNQFDLVQGFLLHFLRTGDRRWWELGDALARHVIDIDIYHTTQDKPAYNGGLFWFTDHYLHAHTSTHRTYSEQNRPEHKIYGGGPSAKHNFTTGLRLHYQLTGHPDSRAAVLSLADWVMAMEEGQGTLWGILEDGPTGLATGSASDQGPDRAGGNSINALLDAWSLTQAEKYLQFAEVLIQRCVHPNQDLEALELLDVENRWSYTVFLSSLAKYLDLKQTAGQQDAAAAYAQASLLHYAKWMLEHERPYFDQREKLEYPTEAWAAQEFRKANVLRSAARYAEGTLRSRLMERGHQLADRAWEDLFRFETRTYARALAIVMLEGWNDCDFRSRQTSSPAPSYPELEWTVPPAFVSQRRRIRDQLHRPSGLVRLAVRIANPLRWTRYFCHRYWITRTSSGRAEIQS